MEITKQTLHQGLFQSLLGKCHTLLIDFTKCDNDQSAEKLKPTWKHKLQRRSISSSFRCEAISLNPNMHILICKTFK